MNKIILIQKITAVFSAIRPMFFAIIGGLIVSGISRCSEQKPVNLIVTNQSYEAQLHALRKTQDSIRHVLPTIQQSKRYLSNRYPDRLQGSTDR